MHRRSYRLPAQPAPKANAAALLALAFLATAAVAPGASAAPTPLNVDVSLFAENFEGTFPGSAWNVTDSDPSFGYDYWGSSTYRASAGTGAAYAAQLGNRSEPITVFSDDLEGNINTSWTTGTDTNTAGAYGNDYWGASTYRHHSGNTSFWSAQFGTNSAQGFEGGAAGAASNAAYHRYDDQSNASFYRAINLSGFTVAYLDYWSYVDTEQCCDFLYAAYFYGGWVFLDPPHNGPEGPTNNWTETTVEIPIQASRVGFFFTADDYYVDEGAYVDDIQVYGTHADQNRLVHMYDDGMNTTMSRAVDASAYAYARVDYRYWLNTNGSGDRLEALYFSGGNWSSAASYSGNSGGWLSGSFSAPSNATQVGFRFVTDGAGRAEGAYLDDIRAWGVVHPLNCTANVSALVGTEVLSSFLYTGRVSDGLRPFIFAWDFGDGRTSTLQDVPHAFAGAGDYTASLSVTDSLGQTCTASAPTVAVAHDLSSVAVGSSVSTLVEGASTDLFGQDAQGHAYSLDWLLAPPECGLLSAPSGNSITFTASPDAGGMACTITGSFGAVSASKVIDISHDVSEIHIFPSAAEVVEGKSLQLSATDRYGHGVSFTWSATCGRVSPDPGNSTVFSATTTGGAVCTVTAFAGASTATAILTVIHDASVITVAPSTATLVEGASQDFTAVDVYGHPFDASWAVAPSACGSFTVATGTGTTFTSSIDAGGLTCTVAVAYEGTVKNITVIVNHDTSTASIAPEAPVAVEGGTIAFTFSDAHGHALSAAWTISPSACGALLPTTGAATTLTLSPTVGGSTCTVSAATSAVSRSVSVAVENGPPASVVVTSAGPTVTAGGSLSFSGVVKTASNHTLTGLVVTWTSSCGVAEPASGPQTVLKAPKEAGGTTCTVTAAFASLTGSATVGVNFAAPFKVTVSPAAPSLSGGATQEFTATVTDAYGQTVPDAPIQWAATCGALSATEGASVTYTAPGDMGGSSCSVTASTAYGGVSTQGANPVKTGMSAIIPLGVVAVGGILGLLFFMNMRRRRDENPDAAPAEAPAAATAPGAPAAPTDISREIAAISAGPTASSSSRNSPAPVVVSVTQAAKAPPTTAPAAPPAAAKPPAAPKAPPTPPKPVAPAQPKRPTAPPPKVLVPPATKTPPAAPAPPPAEAQSAPCPKCGSTVEVGWVACPDCGLDLVWN